MTSWLDACQPAVRQVAKPRTEADAEHGAKDEYVIRGTAGIGVVHADEELGTVMQQAIQDIRCLVVRRRHDDAAVGTVLVGKVGIESLRPGRARIGR